jgi:subtilisin family serine protease
VPANPELADNAKPHDNWKMPGPSVPHARTDEDETGKAVATDPIDRQAGHGTFIAGIVRRYAPNAEIQIQGVLSSFGEATDWDIALGILEGLDNATRTKRGRIDVINMSFGAQTDDDLPPKLLADAVVLAQNQGALVVAAAGNADTCRRWWPAALPQVVAVGATDGCGRKAWFSNFGPWVDACALGVDIVSTFLFDDGPASSIAGVDPDEYQGWALWSGTSFAAPYVAAAIASRMTLTGQDARTAADVLTNTQNSQHAALGLSTIPDLGVDIVLPDPA